jgi:hypothetical protein
MCRPLKGLNGGVVANSGGLGGFGGSGNLGAEIVGGW